jgi:hypothetical protein
MTIARYMSKRIKTKKFIYLMSFYNQVVSTVQALILIIIAVFVIVMLATFFFLPMFLILNTVTPKLDGIEALLSSIFPWA